ncbi:MAG: OmpA family protein [Acidimicrobiaceae bacterium]|nr:OmpA family protein [Acidimicrobiaceae bacterium]
MTGGLRDPRDRRHRDFGPAFGMGRLGRPARRSLPIDLIGGRSTWIAAAVVVAVFLIIAMGSSGPTEEGTTEQDLLARVQGSMVQAGLPTVKVRVLDWMVILEGRVATPELKEAAERVAFAQADVISVQNRLYVPPSVVDSIVTTTVPDLPAALADLVLQSRLSAVAAHPPIQFESGGDRITLESVPTLDRLASFLVFEPAIRVQIIGHTDNDEKVPGDNLRLSAIRAEAVRTQLLARGVEPDRLVTLGLGHTDPIADNITKTGKAANRRIEFLLLREGEVGLPAPTEAGEGDPTEADTSGTGSD